MKTRTRTRVAPSPIAPSVAQIAIAEATVEDIAESLPEPPDSEKIRLALRQIEDQLNGTFVQRADPIRVILLGVLARQNYLLIGPPGTAKTSVIDTFVKHVNVPVRFKILMGKFTQPDHVVGVLDINAFKQGRYEVVTSGMMPEAPLPILDETLKTSDGCMNQLLGILGPEREFQGRRTKIIATGGATNWPEVDGLSKHVEALYDRFLLRCVVTAVDRNNKDLRRALYRAAEKVVAYTPQVTVSLDDIQCAIAAVDQIEISDEILDLLDGVVLRLTAPTKDAQGKLRPSSLEVSDRRATQLQQVLRANAWLEGRTEVTIEDFDVLRHGLWSKRADIEAIVAVLDTVDSARVQDLVRKIDVGRQAYRTLASQGFGAAKINDVAEQIKKIAYEVKEALQKPVFTRKGRAQVRDAMATLRTDFKNLTEQAQKLVGGASPKE